MTKKNLLQNSKKNLALTAGALVGAALSSMSVYAAPAVVYDKDGVVLKLDHGTNGEMRLTVTNNTDEDLHDVLLSNDDIKGLVVSDKQINIGTVKAGETRDIDFKYSLEKATVKVINKVIEEKNKAEKKEVEVKSEASSTPAEKKVDPSVNPYKDGRVQTGDESHKDNKLIKIGIPVVIAGVAGVLVIFAMKKNKNVKKNTLALLVSVGALGTAMFTNGGNIDALNFNVNYRTGRLVQNVPIQGVTVIDGQEYEYAGTFYYEKDDVQVKLEEKALEIGVDIVEDDRMDAGTFKVISDDVKEGTQKFKVTYVNGKEVSREAAADAIPGKNYKVVVGTKPTQEIAKVGYKTVYEAEKSKPIGFKEVSQEGRDGEQIITYKLDSNLDRFKEMIISGRLRGEGTTDLLVEKFSDTEFSRPEIIKIGTRSKSEVPLERKTVYSANNDALITDEPKVLQEGADGLREIETVQNVDPDTGELMPAKEIVSETIKEVSTPKLVQIGAKEIVEEVIPYETVITEDDKMWEGEVRKDVEGVDGLKDVTYIYDVDPDKGLTENKTAIDEKIKKEPVVEKVTHGTKKPKYIEEKEVTPVKPDAPVVEDYVSDEALTKIKSLDDYNNIVDNFNKLIEGKKQLEDGSYVTVEAKDGESGRLYKVATDPDTGEVIPTIEKELIEEVNIPAVEQKSIKLNIKLGETRDADEVYEYVGTDKLELGSTNVVTKAQAGEEQAVVLDNGNTTWVPSEENPAVRGLVEVGNREVVKEELEAAGTVFEMDTMFEGEVIIPEGLEGTPGEQEVTYEYEIDPATGKLGQKKVISTKVIKEAQGGEKWVGILKKDTGKAASQETIQAVLDRLNEVRKEKGLNPVRLASSNQDKAEKQAHVIAARLEQLRLFDHIPGGYNTTLNYTASAGLTDKEVGEQAINDFMASDTSHKDILTEADIDTVNIGAYYISDGTVCIVTVSPVR